MSTDFYPNLPNIDGREEFERLLRGDVGVVAIGRPVIFRRMIDRHCACWDEKTRGGIAYCSYCRVEAHIKRVNDY